MNKKCGATVLLLLCVLFLASCRGNREKDKKQIKEESYTVIKDSTGRKVEIKKEPEKVVALSASLSDVWLLSGGELCGATADVLEEEVVHENLNKKKIKNVGSVKYPDLDAVLSLKPDLVLISGKIPYHIVRMNTLDDYLNVLKQMTEVTGEEDNYEEYGEKAREEADYLLKQVPKGRKTTALVLRAYSADIKVKTEENVVCNILQDIGVKNAAANNTNLSENKTPSLEAISESDPDYIFVTTMGDRKLALKKLHDTLETGSGWEDLKAVKQKHIVILPKELYQYKPNSRWSEAYEYILSIVYPDTFHSSVEESK